MKFVFEQGFAQRDLDFSFAGVGVLPTVEADLLHDLIDVVDDALHYDWRFAVFGFLKQLGQSGSAAVYLVFFQGLALGPYHIFG